MENNNTLVESNEEALGTTAENAGENLSAQESMNDKPKEKGAKAETAQNDEQNRQAEELSVRLFDAEVRLALLMAGIAKERLEESAAIAAGLCKSGKTPEEAAEEIVNAYPHLRAVRRDMPCFSASGVSENDGFSVIRGIFAKR